MHPGSYLNRGASVQQQGQEGNLQGQLQQCAPAASASLGNIVIRPKSLGVE